MKILLLILSCVIFLTDAAEVTDKDPDSPLVSYLLAKVQRLEAKMMSKEVSVRTTREVEERSVNNATNEDDMKTKGCPQVVSYIRWGNTTCPYGANTLYKGTAVGGRYTDKGAPSNLMCLPQNPMRYLNNQHGDEYAFPVEYRTGGAIDHSTCRNMPCSLCEATGRSSKIMIPSHYVCPDGWHKEYNGYIMAGNNAHEGSSMYYCIDENLEQIKSSGGCDGNAQLFYTVRASGSYVPQDGYALSCVVCTK
ncbi:short-chain collagen C4-like [Dysidea avara]|uniref:short-chain collagen C4-like n=1 Tax=Dysidea avara TaxID=196820 RepID=UPI00332F130D